MLCQGLAGFTFALQHRHDWRDHFLHQVAYKQRYYQIWLKNSANIQVSFLLGKTKHDLAGQSCPIYRERTNSIALERSTGRAESGCRGAKQSFSQQSCSTCLVKSDHHAAFCTQKFAQLPVRLQHPTGIPIDL